MESSVQLINSSKMQLFIVGSLFVILGLSISEGREIARVVGGTEAAEGAHPHQISLRVFNSHICGGVIIDNRWVLTAAHCIVGQDAAYLTVVAGTNSLSRGGVTYKIALVLPNRNYNPAVFANDIGLLKTETEIEFNEKVSPAPLPTVDFHGDNHPAVLTGWGRISAGGPIPDKLQELELKLIAQNKCKQIHDMITSDHICTFTKMGEGACNGDSGGPLISDGALVGLVSFGYPCAKGYPDVYTRVWTFMEWIEYTKDMYSFV